MLGCNSIAYLAVVWLALSMCTAAVDIRLMHGTTCSSYTYYQCRNCRNWGINRCCRAPGTAATNYQSRAFGSAEFSNYAYTNLLAIYRSNGEQSCGIAVATRGGTTGTQCLTNRAASKRGANYSNCGNICQGVG